MGDLINGKTPEEIKRWIDSRATCNTCPKEHEVGCEYGARTKDCQMSIDALAYIERLEAAQPKWISVEERLPENEYEVLVYTDRYGGRTEFAYYVRRFEAWYQNFCLLIPNVTHWIPLPKQPKEE